MLEVSSANEKIIQIQELGYNPSIIEHASTFFVCLGKFTTNSEAWVHGYELKRDGIIGYTILSIPNIENEKFESISTENPTYLMLQENPKYRPTIKSKGEINWSGQNVSEFNEGKAAFDQKLIISSGVDLIAGLEDSNPAKGSLMVDVGRALVQTEKKSAPALPYLQKVAECKMAACEEDLIEARFLVADSWHYYWFAPLKGLRAYKEILKEHGEKPEVYARCQIEIAACLLELARMPERDYKASFEDVRRQCEIISSTVKPEFVRVHAVSDLIYAETFIYQFMTYPNQNNKAVLYSKALDLLDNLESKYPSRVREISMANHLLGYLHQELGDWETAKSFYKRNMEKPIEDPDECFYWIGERWNMAERSAQKVKEFAEKRNDLEALQEATVFLESNVVKKLNH